MKTTVELPDDLVEREQRSARHDGTTLRAMIEEGLHLALRSRERRPRKPFRLQPFEGEGLAPEFRTAGWERIRDEIYRDRG